MLLMMHEGDMHESSLYTVSNINIEKLYQKYSYYCSIIIQQWLHIACNVYLYVTLKLIDIMKSFLESYQEQSHFTYKIWSTSQVSTREC